jgi:hypothetical protein
VELRDLARIFAALQKQSALPREASSRPCCLTSTVPSIKTKNSMAAVPLLDQDLTLGKVDLIGERRDLRQLPLRTVREQWNAAEQLDLGALAKHGFILLLVHRVLPFIGEPPVGAFQEGSQLSSSAQQRIHDVRSDMSG